MDRPKKTRTKTGAAAKTEALEQIAQAQTEKANCLAYSTHCEQHGALEHSVEQLKQNKRKHLRELKESDVFAGRGTKAVKLYLEKLKKKRKTEDNITDNENDNFGSQDTTETGDSLDDYRMAGEAFLDCEESIREKNTQMADLKKAMSIYLGELKKTWDADEED